MIEGGDVLELLYGPRDNEDLRKTYPELSDHAEFKKISKEELLFVWYISNKSSPIDPLWLESTKYATAASIAFKNNPKKREDFANQQISEDVKVAMKKMATFNPKARAIAKRMIQSVFLNLQKIANVDINNFVTEEEGKDGEKVKKIDWTARKQYVDMSQKISEMAPQLVKQMEEGFGIEIKKKDEEGMKAIDKFHKTKTD